MSSPFRDATLPGHFPFVDLIFPIYQTGEAVVSRILAQKNKKSTNASCVIQTLVLGGWFWILGSAKKYISASRNLPKSTIFHGNLMVSVSKFWEQNPFWPLLSDSSFWKGDYSKPKSAAGTKVTRNEHLSFVQSLGISGSAPRWATAQAFCPWKMDGWNDDSFFWGWSWASAIKLLGCKQPTVGGEKLPT